MTLHPAALCAVLLLMLPGLPASARMAPKYERVGFLAAALEHLSDVAGMMDDPIERIEVAGDQVRFVAGRCRVVVIVEDRPQSGPPVPGGGDYVGKVGRMSCN